MSINTNVLLGKQGVSLIEQKMVEWGCLFTKVGQEEDYGIDAFVEMTIDNQLIGKVIALQIKTGNSYFSNDKKYAKIKIGNHRRYWESYDLPVFGVVVDYDNKDAYWINITEFLLKEKKDILEIKFKIGDENNLNNKNSKIQLLQNLNSTIKFENINIEQLQVLNSTYDTIKKISNYEFYDDIITWERMFKLLTLMDNHDKLVTLVIRISEVIGNPDSWIRKSLTKEILIYLLKKIEEFRLEEVVKLLEIIDDEFEFERGAIGQCVETIIKVIPLKEQILLEILEKISNNKIFLRALLLLAYYNPKLLLEKIDANSNLHEKIVNNEIGNLIMSSILEYGFIDLY